MDLILLIHPLAKNIYYNVVGNKHSFSWDDVPTQILWHKEGETDEVFRLQLLEVVKNPKDQETLDLIEMCHTYMDLENITVSRVGKEGWTIRGKTSCIQNGTRSEYRTFFSTFPSFPSHEGMVAMANGVSDLV